MSSRRGGLRTDLLLAVTAAMTTWIALWSWGGFTTVPGRYLRPLFFLALLVAATGVLARWWRLPAAVVVALQVLVSGLACSMALSGSLIPVGGAWDRLTQRLGDAVDTANRYAAPVPDGVPGVHPLLIPGGLACLLLVDVLVCTARRVPLAGLPLLTIYSIPVSLLGGGVYWWIFVLTAAGFLTLLFLQESEQVARWGRPLGQDLAEGESAGLGVAAASAHTSAGTIGSVATVLALCVPLLIPTLDLHLLGGGHGSGGDAEITVKNPMTDLRRDLIRVADFPLLQVTTDDPTPDYLRISVLNRFSDNEWSSGDRDVPTTNVADGSMPTLVGVSSTMPRTEYHYDVTVGPDFKSTWLPTRAPISEIHAQGDWRYDDSTMDFIAGDKDLTTAGLSYSMTSVHLDLSASDLANASTTGNMVGAQYTDLPTDLPPMVRTLANEVTRDAPSRFEKAVALQQWFSSTGGFTYSTHAQPGNGVNDLVRFLSDNAGGRVGYCEQFASAMAVMARTLQIPARVAVGFLAPEQVGPNTYEYSSHDLHAWPELFFPGSGWVLFEPTPAGAGTSVPSYTTQQVPVINPTARPDASASANIQPSHRPNDTANPSESTKKAQHASGVSGFPWLPVGGGVLAVGLAAALAMVPRAVRRARRRRRVDGGPEEVWAELRDTALDLGVPWPEGRSPQETRRRLARFFGVPVDGQTAERPAHGPEVAPEAVAALDRIVRTLELSRYARHPGPDAPLRADVETCLAALAGGAVRGARRRAEWWPRSVVSRSGGQQPTQVQRPVEARYGGVVDHVG